jgi:hypothetical protein
MKYLALSPLFLLLVSACSSTTTVTESTTDAGTDAPTATADAGGAETGGDAGGAMCSAAIDQNLKLVDKVATTNVSILSDANGTRLLFIDASAGGPMGAATNPYIYVNLETATRVNVTDKTARTSNDWDLALKRAVLFTNGGDAGGGMGGTISVMKPFDSVTKADASGTFAPEAFFDASCNLNTDQVGSVMTTFSNWYNYDLNNNTLSPMATTFVVKGGTGKLYKLAIQNYYGQPDGGMGMAGALYLVKVAAL